MEYLVGEGLGWVLVYWSFSFGCEHWVVILKQKWKWSSQALGAEVVRNSLMGGKPPKPPEPRCARIS